MSVADYVAVTSTPRPPPIEFIPARPRKDAVWVDGSWDWAGNRYGWKSGTWAVVPQGLKRARWVVVRRKIDGQLFFAPSTWKDAHGNTVDDSGWIHALGPTARASSRMGGPPEMDEPLRPPPRPPNARDEERKPEDTTKPPQKTEQEEAPEVR